MASDAIQAVVEFLRINSPLSGSTILEKRQSMDQATGILPPPEDVSFQPIDAGGVPAEWTDAPEVDPERVVLYFHGGAYTMGGITTHRQFCADLSRAAGMRVLSVDYRLAPEAPFPAAVEDGVAAYRFLLAQGFPASKIAIAGDSAGGGLTAATLLALRDEGEVLPGAGVLISPWLDLTQTAESFETRADQDPLVSRADLQLMADAYLAGGDPRQPLASPLFAELSKLPPLLIHVGTAEVLFDDSVHFAEKARAAGVDVEIEEWQEMIHVWHCFGAMIPEAAEATAVIGGFLKSRLD